MSASRGGPRFVRSRASSGAHSAALLMLCTVGARPLEAQPGLQRATRVALTAQVATLEQQLAGGSVRGDARRQALTDVATIRQRLTDGDFRVGDRFVVSLRVDSVRTDTLYVRDSMNVAVFNLPEANIRGALRSELEERLSTHVARFLRNASVRVTVLTRVSVAGAVNRPGIYYVTPDRPLIDLLTVAGGPAQQANIDQVEVRRGATVIVKPKGSDRVLKGGRTLEQVDVQSGDEVRVPFKRKVNWQLVVQLFFVVTSLLFALLQFLQWYVNRQDS